MAELEMVIAECPYCKACFYSWSEEDATRKYYEHDCTATLLEKELAEIAKAKAE